MSLRATLTTSLLVFAALCAPAGAQTELTAGIGDQGNDEQNPIALAGDQVVFQSRIAFDRIARLEAVTFNKRRRVLTLVRPTRGDQVSVRFDAAPGRLAFSVHEGQDENDDTLLNEVRTGPLAGPYETIDRCEGGGGAPREVRTGPAAVIHANNGCERQAVMYRALDGSGFVRQLSSQFPATFLLTTAMAGRFSVFEEVVRENGNDLYAPQEGPGYRPGGAVAIQDDGKVVFSPRGAPLNPLARCGTELVWHSPAEPQPHKIPGVYCGGDIAMAGDRIVGLRQAGQGGELVSVNLTGGDERVVARFDAIDRLHSVDTDGTNVVWAEGNCQEDSIWLSRPGDPAKAPENSRRCTFAPASLRAPVKGGKALVKVRCPNGCRGVRIFVNQPGVPRPITSDTVAFAKGGTVKVPLLAAQRRRAARGRSPFNVKMTFIWTDELNDSQRPFTRTMKLVPPR